MTVLNKQAADNFEQATEGQRQEQTIIEKTTDVDTDKGSFKTMGEKT